MDEREADRRTAAAVTHHIKRLLHDARVPDLLPDIADVPDMREIHEYLVGLRSRLKDYSRGDFSADVHMRGVMAGMVKALQANMRHLIWQMERVQGGNLSQRVDCMGEFSVAFNNMVRQLDDALTALHEKEEALTAITGELQQEVEKRGAALAALQKSEENFKYLAEHDALTGLLNRRSFFAQAEVELARNAIMDDDSCIAVMDVDHFKQFNDTHGHLGGDEALRHIAKIGLSTLRANDIMGRLGGEEFVFLFSKAGLEQGRLAADRIRARLASTPVPLEDGPVPVTASLGVAAIAPGVGEDNVIERALRTADEALYRAKAHGRNQVRVAKMSPSIRTMTNKATRRLYRDNPDRRH